MENKYAFERKFAEFIADVLAICYEYVEGRAEKIYVYLEDEARVQTSGFFYKINGKVVMRGKLNTALRPGEKLYADYPDRQGQVQSIIREDWNRFAALCRQYNKPVPTEIRMVYDVKTKKPDVRIQYDPVWSNKGGFPMDVEEAWFEKEAAAAADSGTV